MINSNLLKKYAHLLIKMGCNVQPGQLLYIQADSESDYFVRYCVEEAYRVGAKRVIVDYNDQAISLLRYQYEAVESMEEVTPYALDKLTYLMEQGACRLNVYSPVPGLLEDIDPTKIQKVAIAQMKPQVMKDWRNFSMANRTQWCLASVPNAIWAQKVFPMAKSADEAMKMMWDAILKTVHIDEEVDIVEFWKEHNLRLHQLSTTLNDFNFKSLHFKNSLGTDIEVGLVKNHRWCGGSELSSTGVEFNPNMPTEETFTMPDRNRVDGKVYSTKPLNYGGTLIDEFYLEFKDGKVIDSYAKQNNDSLNQLLNFDEGARHLGEIALISHNSPISNSNILYYNTLFDENASCHMALGAAYPMNVVGGTTMSQEELALAGANRSSRHEDFMFGSSDMSIYGETYEGAMIEVFKNGNFVF